MRNPQPDYYKKHSGGRSNEKEVVRLNRPGLTTRDKFILDLELLDFCLTWNCSVLCVYETTPLGLI